MQLRQYRYNFAWGASIGLAASLAAAAGCGDRSAGPTTYPVTGVVTMDGQPVSDALVTFTPTGAGDAVIAGGQANTAVDGSYDVTIFVDQGKTTQRGLPPGSYRVTVVKMESPPGDPSLTKPPRNVLPPKYASSESTTLGADVKAHAENRFDFQL